VFVLQLKLATYKQIRSPEIVLIILWITIRRSRLCWVLHVIYTACSNGLRD